MANLNINKSILGGRLTADPELKQTQGGVYVVSFQIAVNRRYTKEGDQQTADFFSCVAWKDRAEFICKFFRKGSSICVVGELQNRQWTDQQNNKRYSTELRVDEVFFVDSKDDAQNATGAAQGGNNTHPSNYTPNTQNAPQRANHAAQQQAYGQPGNYTPPPANWGAPMQGYAPPQNGGFQPVNDDENLPF